MRTINLLDSLSKQELTSLGKYLKSPFFTNKPYLYKLFIELRRAGKSAVQDTDKIFTRIFPKKKPVDNHLWNKALSDLNGCIEDFLAVQQLTQNRSLYNQALVDACYERLNEPVMQQATLGILNQLPGLDAPEQLDGWHLRLWGQKRILAHPIKDRIKLNVKSLDVLESDLEVYYLISKTQIICNRVSGGYFFGWEEEIKKSLDWFNVLKNTAQNHSSNLLKVYFSTLALLLEQLDFPNFFVDLKALAPKIHTDELRDIVRLGFNFCTRQDRLGESRALEWYIALFNWSNENGLWSTSKAEELFLNLGVLFSKSQRRPEFQELLNGNLYALPEKRREQAVILLQGCWSFYANEFEKAQTELARVIIRHPRYSLLRHAVNVRNAYMLWKKECIDTDLLKTHLDSFNNFLDYNNNPFSKDFIESYRALVRVIRQMSGAGLMQTSTAVVRLEILSRKPACQDWLEKVLNHN